MPFRRSSGPRRAVTLIEAVLFTAVALTLIVGGLVFFQQAQTARQTQEAVRLVRAIVSETRSLYSRFDLEEVTDLTPILIKSGAVPASVVQNNGIHDYIMTPWGDVAGVHRHGEIEIWGGPLNEYPLWSAEMHGADVGKDGLILSIWNVPAEVCTRIAQFDPDGSGPLGDGIAAVTTWEWMKFSVSQRVYDENPGNSGIVSIGVTPAYAAELCKDIEGSGWWNMHVYYYWD